MLVPARARADEPVDRSDSGPVLQPNYPTIQEPPSKASLRGILGVGGGSVGMGGLLALQAEYWPGPVVGITGQLGTYALADLEIFGEENHSSGVVGVGLLTVRSAPGRSYAFLGLGSGLATEEHVTRRGTLNLFSNNSPPQPEYVSNTTRPLVAGSLGVIWNPTGAFQIGVALHAYQSMSDFGFVMLGLHVGGVI